MEFCQGPSGQPDPAPKLSAAASPCTQLEGSRAQVAEGSDGAFSGRQIIWGTLATLSLDLLMDQSPSFSRTFPWLWGSYLQTSSFYLILFLRWPLWLAGTDCTWPGQSWPVPALSSALLGRWFVTKDQAGDRVWEQCPWLCSKAPNLDLGVGERGICVGSSNSRLPEASVRSCSS